MQSQTPETTFAVCFLFRGISCIYYRSHLLFVEGDTANCFKETCPTVWHFLYPQATYKHVPFEAILLTLLHRWDLIALEER